ncbi:MAG: NAD(P)-dependent oxidoreductase [Pseudomonadota bacterium]
MDYLPIFMDVRGRCCVVVGGGEVAARKVAMLLRAGARVTVVSPQLVDELEQRKRGGELAHIDATFSPACLDDAVLVIAATDDNAANRAVHQAALQRRLPVNVVDALELCSFIMPSVLDRSPLLVAFSSGGRFPMLTRWLRARLETLIPSGYGKLAQVAGELRDEVRRRLPQPESRRAFWREVLEGTIPERASSDDAGSVRLAMLDTLEKAGGGQNTGEVCWVGVASPEPDLLTFRALRLMQRADVVFYDRAVGKGVLDLVRRDAEQRPVAGGAVDDVIEAMLALACEGRHVLRLADAEEGAERLRERCIAVGIPCLVSGMPKK